MRLVISVSRRNTQRPIPSPVLNRSDGLAMVRRGRKKHLLFFPMKILGRKKSVNSAEAAVVVAGVKDAEAGAEAVDSAGEDMVAPIVIRRTTVDGAVPVVEDVDISTRIIVPTGGIMRMIAVTVVGVVDIRETITTEAIPMATNNLLTIAVAGITTMSSEGTTTITTEIQGVINRTTTATISLHRMIANTS